MLIHSASCPSLTGFIVHPLLAVFTYSICCALINASIHTLIALGEEDKAINFVANENGARLSSSVDNPSMSPSCSTGLL
jgi:hypothetical protein